MNLARACCWLGLLVCALTFSGCAASGVVRIPESEFIYPNSNVTPLEDVDVSSTFLCGAFGDYPILRPRQERDELLETAKEQSGADVIINANFEVSVVDVLLFAICTTRVTGQGVKVELGRQDLR